MPCNHKAFLDRENEIADTHRELGAVREQWENLPEGDPDRIPLEEAAMALIETLGMHQREQQAHIEDCADSQKSNNIEN